MRISDNRIKLMIIRKKSANSNKQLNICKLFLTVRNKIIKIWWNHVFWLFSLLAYENKDGVRNESNELVMNNTHEEDRLR